MSLTYDPDFAAAAAPMLAAIASAPQPTVHNIDELRAMLDSWLGGLPDLSEVPDIEETIYHTPSYDGHLVAIHHYAPKRESAAPAGPAVLHAHGGGFISGSAAMFRIPMQGMVKASGVPIFSVDYRLAPESPFPAAAEDMYAALTWLHEHAEEVGVDRTRIATMGESVGATLATSAALMARDRNLSPPLAKQLLIYPCLDDRTTLSDPALEPLLLWKQEHNLTAWTAYLGQGKVGSDHVSPYAAPARATRFDGSPETYIDVGEFDLFKDESVRYAGLLEKAGTKVTLEVYPGVPHSFELFAFASQATQRAMGLRVAAMRSF
ncbi:Alpha/Beta hydrolase protein [Aspergillus avenaceus]|uniref:Alpha/Beta hydrolase protein n=1 Tax=Aspergillus avenaceus TaxID=36643 RepID=A0A5N6U4U2_ASPAV|nr:Alpha/Beta hydrolase protein [Aspergillus avenaceus]